MPKILDITDQAQKDFDRVWFYTHQNYGLSQAKPTNISVELKSD